MYGKYHSVPQIHPPSRISPPCIFSANSYWGIFISHFVLRLRLQKGGRISGTLPYTLFYESFKNWGYYAHVQTVCVPGLSSEGRGLGMRLIVNLPTEYRSEGASSWGKQVKQHYHVTSSQKLYWWRSTIWQILGKDYCVKFSKEIVYLHGGMRLSFLLIVIYVPISDTVWRCAHVSF